MSMTRIGSGLCVIACVLALAALPRSAAQPPKEAPKWPAIAPDKAKLEQTFRGLDGPGLALAANETTMMVAAVCDQHCIHLWHKDALLGLRDGSHAVDVLTGHQGAVLTLAWRHSVLASAGADKKILLWDAPEGKLLHTLDSGPLVRCLALSPDGKTLAGAGDGSDIRLWDVEKGKAAGEWKGHTDWVQCLQFSDDGKQALLGRADGNIDQVNIADGQKVRSFTGHASAVTGLLYHPTGTLAVSCSKDGSIRLWNPANGTLIKALTDHTAWVEGVALLAQGTRLVSVSADQTVRVWSLTGP